MFGQSLSLLEDVVLDSVTPPVGGPAPSGPSPLLKVHAGEQDPLRSTAIALGRPGGRMSPNEE